MVITLDYSGDTPIYLQLRNQIVLGIADGRLRAGEKLPTIRTLAEELGINMMTVSKAYQMLRQEGYIASDRRNGAWVAPGTGSTGAAALEKLEREMRLAVSEARVAGIDEEQAVALCRKLFREGEK